MNRKADYVTKKDECIYCGSHENIQWDHIIAQSKGGRTVVPACQDCNLSKSDKALMDWFHCIKKTNPKKWEKICEYNKRKLNPIAKKVRKVRDEKPKKSK